MPVRPYTRVSVCPSARKNSVFTRAIYLNYVYDNVSGKVSEKSQHFLYSGVFTKIMLFWGCCGKMWEIQTGHCWQ